ncbi:hypothetical protein [Mycobacteroides abscessus]|uniref:hypothetical protein n=1 Tax=Mycobacteroides abscessus TaxID=36809 RepID=UPI000927B8A0|nr:hypothetical protein [Mycobacteroides abscessus]SIJ94390.1 Uncharacterised protein [Mycobacteroides abscessus subsp. abscessus]
MNETAHHILAAERHLTELQEQQLRSAETSPEAAGALRAARTRAVLKLAAQLGAGVGTLHDLRIVMEEMWSVQVEQAGMLGAHAEEWAEANCSGDTDDEWEVQSVAWLIEELWPDVVAETDAWARGVLGDAE